jgi:tight adherence protein C
MLLLIGILCFASAALAIYGLLHRPVDPVAQRILPAGESAPEIARPQQARPISRILSGMGRRLSGVLPQNLAASVEKMLVYAGSPWPLSAFLGGWMASIAGGVLFVFYIAAVGNLTGIQTVALGMTIISLAVMIPYALLRNRVKKRQTAIIRSLPDAMDLLVTCVEAGMAVDAAFSMVTEKTEGPLSEAFTQYLRQVSLGRPRREALLFVAERTGVEDMVDMARAIGQGEDLGTTIGDVLRLQSQDLRAVRRQRAQEAAQRAPVLMTIPLVLCFMPAMGAVVVVPSLLNLVGFIGDIGG